MKERHALKEILWSAGRQVLSYYIRTAKELSELVSEFHDSNFRYLHLACHGNPNVIQLAYDSVPLEELAFHCGARTPWAPVIPICLSKYARTVRPSIVSVQLLLFGHRTERRSSIPRCDVGLGSLLFVDGKGQSRGNETGGNQTAATGCLRSLGHSL